MENRRLFVRPQFLETWIASSTNKAVDTLQNFYRHVDPSVRLLKYDVWPFQMQLYPMSLLNSNDSNYFFLNYCPQLTSDLYLMLREVIRLWPKLAKRLTTEEKFSLQTLMYHDVCLVAFYIWEERYVLSDDKHVPFFLVHHNSKDSEGLLRFVLCLRHDFWSVFICYHQI